MVQYILEQVENGNYVEFNPSEARLDNHQLHFVGYNYVVSATSSFTKVKMMTDSPMQTESGLSLNGVTKPAPGEIPSSEASYSAQDATCITLCLISRNFFIQSEFQTETPTLPQNRCRRPSIILLQTSSQPVLDFLPQSLHPIRRQCLQ